MGDSDFNGWHGVGGHSLSPSDWAEGSRLAAEFRAKQKQRHKDDVAARKVARDDAKRVERENGGSVYGPPSPFAYRKGFRPPMKMARD